MRCGQFGRERGFWGLEGRGIWVIADLGPALSGQVCKMEDARKNKRTFRGAPRLTLNHPLREAARDVS